MAVLSTTNGRNASSFFIFPKHILLENSLYYRNRFFLDLVYQPGEFLFVCFFISPGFVKLCIKANVYKNAFISISSTSLVLSLASGAPFRVVELEGFK